MFKPKFVILFFLLLVIGSISNFSSHSFMFVQYSGKSFNEKSSSSEMSIPDVLKIISFPTYSLPVSKISNITIAVIDSGINKSLIKNYWVNSREIPNNSLDDDHNGYIDDYYGWDFITNTSIQFSGNFSSHGTFISNIISTMTSSISNIHIMDIRVLNSNNKNENYESFIHAIEYALLFSDVKVIQFSIEFLTNFLSSYPPLLHWIFEKAYFRHVAIVSVSGNSAKNTLSAPGNWAETLSVTSADQLNGKWVKSQYANNGSNIDITVPGSNIQSIDINGKSLVLSGTSFSSAFTGGAIAILDAMFNNRNMSVQTIRGLVQSSANSLGECSQFGAGLLNITNLLKLSQETDYLNYTPKCEFSYVLPVSLDSPPQTKSLSLSIFLITLPTAVYFFLKRKIRKLK